MQETVLKIRYFGRGLSKSFKNLTLFFISNSIPFNEQDHEKRGLKLVNSGKKGKKLQNFEYEKRGLKLVNSGKKGKKLQNFEYLENKNSFSDERKRVFHSFEGLSFGEKICNSGQKL